MAIARVFVWGFHVQFTHSEVAQIAQAIAAGASVAQEVSSILAAMPSPPTEIAAFVVQLANAAASVFAGLMAALDQGNGVFVSMSWFAPGIFIPTTVVMAGPPPETATVDGTGPVMPIESIQFPNVFLRVDGTGVNAAVGPGGGTVNCQFGAGPYEKLRFVDQGDGSVAIASVQFPNVCLRLDGHGVTSFAGAGAGVVNCQFGVGPWEKFRLRDQGGQTLSIESAAFPGVFLRLDGTNIHAFAGAGAGVVNCQFGAGPYEKFRLRQM